MTISLTSPALASAGFSHGFSTREVDLRFDAPDYSGNLMRFGKAAGLDPFCVAQARQVHGIQVVDATVARAVPAIHPGGAALAVDPAHLPEADAIVASPGLAAGIRVADCVPILVGDPVSGIAAAIHAGWRGTVAGVIQNALLHLLEAGGDPTRAVAAIGPCICTACFEVGDDVAARITHVCGDAVASAVAGHAGAHTGKPHVNLRLAARILLSRTGVGTIEDVPGCTRCEKDRFFSYRRDREASGRHLAAIAAIASRA